MHEDEDGMGLRAFGRAILAHWFTAMSGPLSVPATIAALYVTNDLAKALLGLTAFACVWAAAYAIWRSEHSGLIALRKRVRDLEAELVRTKPKLRGIVEQGLWGEMTDDRGNKKTTCLVNFTIRNTGAPSIADSYELTLRQDGVEHICQLELFKNINIPQHGQLITLNGARDGIYDKTATPIPTGGQARGWLFGCLETISFQQVNKGNVDIIVGFVDVNGEKITTVEAWAGGESSPLTYKPDGTGGPQLSYPGAQNA